MGLEIIHNPFMKDKRNKKTKHPDLFKGDTFLGKKYTLEFILSSRPVCTKYIYNIVAWKSQLQVYSLTSGLVKVIDFAMGWLLLSDSERILPQKAFGWNPDVCSNLFNTEYLNMWFDSFTVVCRKILILSKVN